MTGDSVQAMAKQFILWDNDGVLVDTEPLYFEATRRCIAPLGVQLDLEVYIQDMASGKTAWEYARAVGATEADIAHHRAQRDRLYQQLIASREIALPGVQSALEELSGRYRMAIVTTAKREDFDLIHRDRPFVSHMEFVLASGDYPRAKPAPDPYVAALQRFGAEAETAVVIEDSERGLRAAVAAGIDCVIVKNSFVSGQDFSRADHVIAHIGELPALLAKL